jgi:DNA polymerase III subunit gamma/tau
MSYQVLARKWRPRKFVDVVGQEPVVAALQNALSSGRLHHAYLLTGTRGVGKTTLARILAKSLNCETGVTAEPCGVCKACTEIDQGRFIDLLEVDAASNTGVNDMRELLETAQYVPTAGRYKVYIVDEVHMLSKSAFNAMLKTLEEPPEHVKFILATTDPQKLPITVLSRCLQFNLRNLPPALIAQHLANVLNAENVSFEAPALAQIGHAAAGSVRDSLSILDQAIAYGGGHVAAVQVSEMLGSATKDVLYPLLAHVVAGDGPSLVAELSRISNIAISFDSLLQDIAATLHRVALLQALPATQREQAQDLDSDAQLLKLTTQLSPENTQVFYQIALLARRDMPYSPDEATALSMAMLRMLTFVNGAAASSGSSSAIGGSNVGRTSTGAVGSAGRVASSPNATPSAAQAIVLKPAPPVAQRPSVDRIPDIDQSIAQSKQSKFDGNWYSFIAQAQLGGLSQMVARHAHFERIERNHFFLTVDKSSAQFAQASYRESLLRDLQKAFGSNAKLSIDIAGEVIVNTTARGIDDQARLDKLAEAKTLLLNSPFGQSLVNDFGARIDDASIRVGDIVSDH